MEDDYEKTYDPELDRIFAAEEQTEKTKEKDFQFQSKERLMQEEKEEERELTLFEKKMQRMFGGASNVTTLFYHGFRTGCAVGLTFGGVLGCITAVQARSISMVPMVAIPTGLSFGFFMGIGAIFRSGYMEGIEDLDGSDNIYEIKEFQIK